jgi:hypothetical protein
LKMQKISAISYILFDEGLSSPPPPPVEMVKNIPI